MNKLYQAKNASAYPCYVQRQGADTTHAAQTLYPFGAQSSKAGFATGGFIKSIIIGITLVLCTAACKKEDDSKAIAPGTRFTLKNISLSNLTKLQNGINTTPVNPFVVDSVYDLNGYDNFYYCHSANNMVYKMPESDMKFMK